MKCFNIIVLITYIIATNLVVGLQLTPGPVSCNYKNKDLDDSYDPNSDVSINCSGSSCTVKGSGATMNNDELIITAAGTYIIQGSLQGHVLIQATEEDFVHIVLNNATISSRSGPAIYGITSGKVTITLVGDNKLTDTTNYTVVEEEPDGCIFVDADLSINGSGSLNVTGNYSDAIRCKKDLKLISGNITIPNANKKGIKARNSICVLDANLDITSNEASIKATKDTDPEKGYIVIDGGKINISSNKKGIQAETHVTINGGYIDIKNSKEGIEGQMIDILGGEIHVFSTNDGINAPDPNNTTGWPNGQAKGNVYINIVGGKVYVHVKGNELDCIDANGALYIGGNAEVYVSMNGGSIFGFYAALDADEELYIAPGATIIATAGGSGGGGFGGGFWKRDEVNKRSSRNLKKRQWGNWNNGNNGGFGGGFPGGMGGGMGIVEGKIYQPSISINIPNQNEKTPLTIKDNTNNVIASYTPPNAYASLLISSPKLVAGQTYTIVAGSTSQTAVASAAENGNPNPPSVTTPPENVPVVTKTTKTNKPSPTNNSSTCNSSILAMGYKCCSEGCTVEYTDNDGNWGVENGEWCGCGSTEEEQSTSPCSKNITSQGYKCCSVNCVVSYTDNDGGWGIENGEWCGCTKTTAESCSSAILAKGFSCCSDSNCKIEFTDDDGKWGVENEQWCGISTNC